VRWLALLIADLSIAALSLPIFTYLIAPFGMTPTDALVASIVILIALRHYRRM
jgi:hypothetical protein